MELRIKSAAATIGRFAFAALSVAAIPAFAANGSKHPARHSDPHASLAATINALTATPPFDHALWGIVVEDDDGTVRYAHNAHALFVPASNRKLFTAAAASECLGLDHRFATELWLDGPQNGDVAHGDLVLRGGGDPEFGGRYALDRDSIFAPFIAALRARGIARIEGDVVADVSLFDRETVPGSWKTGDLADDYAAPVDALAYNENVVGLVVRDPDCNHPFVETDPPFAQAAVDVQCTERGEPVVHSTIDNMLTISGSLARSGSGRWSDLAAVANPALYAAQALRSALDGAGIVVTGATRVSAEPHAWRERLGTIDSPPLFELLAITLKVSQNLYAETMLKNLSAGGERPASYAASLDAERAFLTTEVGVAGDEIRFADGCGLSTDDLATPAALIDVIRWIDTPPRRAVFWQMLTTPAEEGTLHRRLLELHDRVRAKTGSLNGVNALTGIIAMPNGRRRYVSIVVNHHDGRSADALKLIDAIVRAAAE